MPTEMGISLAELFIRSPEPLSTSSSESWLHVYPDIDGNTPLADANIHDPQLHSPAMSSHMFLDTPRETPMRISVEGSSEDTELDPNNSAADIGDSSAATRADTSEPTEMVQQSNARKRKAPRTGQHSKRNNSQQAQAPRGEIECLQVERYIEMEKEKCAKLGVPYDHDNYLSPAMTEWIDALDKEDERAAVSIISTAIGSSDSIALFQQILVSGRANGVQTKPSEDLSLADRVREILQLGREKSFIEFLRRCHVWKLYTDISGEVSRQESSFVVMTSESMRNPKGGRAGNPKNKRASEITKTMICGSASELELDTPEKRKEYRTYTKLRKLGQRLEVLTKTFGVGVLGLILSQDPLEVVDPCVRISDET
jgi:hypothetical protein